MVKKIRYFQILSLVVLGTTILCGGEEVKAVFFPFREAVISTRADSTLLTYNFKIGEPFEAGDIVVSLDDARYKLEEKIATDHLEFANATYEDQKQLREKNFTSDFELKKAEYSRLVAENENAVAQLNHSYCQIKSPFSGKIVEIMTREYESVCPGQPLFRIIDDNQLLALINVPMYTLALTTIGNSVSIRIVGSDLEAKGTVYEVTPQAEHRTGTVRVRVLIDNHEGRFKAGMTGVITYDQ